MWSFLLPLIGAGVGAAGGYAAGGKPETALLGAGLGAGAGYGAGFIPGVAGASEAALMGPGSEGLSLMGAGSSAAPGATIGSSAPSLTAGQMGALENAGLLSSMGGGMSPTQKKMLAINSGMQGAGLLGSTLTQPQQQPRDPSAVNVGSDRSFSMPQYKSQQRERRRFRPSLSDTLSRY